MKSALRRIVGCLGATAIVLSTCSLRAQDYAGERDVADVHGAVGKAIDELFSAGYPKKQLEYICSLGTNRELGFRWAGTTAEHATGIRVLEEMQAMGLKNARREPVPVDVFEFTKAAVTVGAREMTASAFAGVRPTPDGGVTAPVVSVKGGTAADFDEAGDVSGKIVLIDNRPSSWWPSTPCLEASYRKAAGIILTFTPEDPKYYSFNRKTLGAFDSCYDYGASPVVYLSHEDGDWLKSRIQSGETRATLVLEEKVTLAKDGGVGYNVVGELPGSKKNGQIVLLMAHQDAHFRAAMDDTGGLVNMLTIAKAMNEARYRPQNTIVFMATCGEEFGRINTYYDWLAGSSWAISREHRDWAGRIRAAINVEAMAVKGTALSMFSNPELKPWLRNLCEAHSHYLPYGSKQETPVWSWNDQWPCTARGIPSVVFDTGGLKDMEGSYPPRYHTNFDTEEFIDWDYLAKAAKFIQAVVQELDDGVLPYNLEERASDLAAATNRDELLKAGADASAVASLIQAVTAFQANASAFQTSCNAIPQADVPLVNEQLLEIEKTLNCGLTALSPKDDATVYPHEAVLADIIGLASALEALTARVPDGPAALKALESIGDTALGTRFSYPVYQKLISRKHPAYEHIGFAALGNLPIPLDVIPEYREVEKGRFSQAASNLKVKHRKHVSLLDERVKNVASVLREANVSMKELLATMNANAAH